jgi:XTP/dITP diphosphohydrolase
VNIVFVTSNVHKAQEVAAFFAGIAEITHVPLECPEYRDDDIGEIARRKAEHAFGELKVPLMVDDTGFSISALKGFPGPYAAYVHRTIGNEGILKLMEGVDNRRAWFETAIAYAEDTGIHIFRGRLEGEVVPPRGSGGFGYDPIFAFGGKTLSEYSLAEKSTVSHRGKALLLFREWFLERMKPGTDSGLNHERVT